MKGNDPDFLTIKITRKDIEEFTEHAILHETLKVDPLRAERVPQKIKALLPWNCHD